MADQISRPIAYTANPLLLMFNDLLLFLQITFTWPVTAGLLSTLLPLFPMRSGALDELGFSAGNINSIIANGVLIFAQTIFLLSLFPLALVGLPVLYFVYAVGFVYVNKWVSNWWLNGPRHDGLFESHPDCVNGNWPKHEHEQWIFINGVSVGKHWLQSNLDLLAMTFRRPVFGIHNQTRGIIFDVLECIIQRDLGFATTDIRDSYAALVDVLAKDHIHKVVLILHSQGGIEGGLVLDWLYDTVPGDQLRKLEIYTFGNAANHWNAPLIIESKTGGPNGGPGPQRLVPHIEHYANEGDYVAKFGVLHFRPDQARPQGPRSSSPGGQPPSAALPQPPSTIPTTPLLLKQKASTVPQVARPKLKTTALKRSSTWTPSPKTPIERLRRTDLQEAQENNRFFGRLFKRASSGHLLNMHYLDYMFQMEGVDPEDRSKGRVSDGNEFMDKEVDLEVFDEWNTVQAVGERQPVETDSTDANGANGSGSGIIRKTVKELSRLWAYRNGGEP